MCKGPGVKEGTDRCETLQVERLGAKKYVKTMFLSGNDDLTHAFLAIELRFYVYSVYKYFWSSV